MSQTQLPKGDSQWFVHDRFGLFIHWGTYALAARHEWVKSKEEISDQEYQKYFEHFYPDLYDPKQWAKMARQAGMKYFVITTRHHEGFSLWDTKHSDYKATNTPWAKDLLGPMVEAFREEGLKVGFYYSLLDWHHDQYTTDKFHPGRNDPERRKADADRDMSQYAAFMRNQVEELLTQFGKIDIIWYDFSFPGEDGKGRDDWESQKLFDLTRKLQPDILIDNRLNLPGSGDFVTPEQFQPARQPTDDEGNPAIWEACQTFSGSWGYHRDEQTWKSVKQLLWMLIDGVSKNGNLLLNVGPTARGEFDARARDRLEGIGRWMHHNSRSIYGCGAAPEEFETPDDCRLTFNPQTRRLYVHVLNWPMKTLWLTGQAYAEQIEYAQLLHDASEIQLEGIQPWQTENAGSIHGDAVGLKLPIIQPDVEVPVIELFLKG